MKDDISNNQLSTNDGNVLVVGSKKHAWVRENSAVSICKNCGCLRVYEKDSGYKRYREKETPLISVITMPKCR